VTGWLLLKKFKTPHSFRFPIRMIMFVFQQTIQKRGAAVIAARKLSSAMSAAKASCDHMRDWFCGTPAVSCCSYNNCEMFDLV